MLTHYEWIIVGAGSAGAVLAERLTRDPHVNVLLIEGGPDHRPADTPAAIVSPNWYGAPAEPGRSWDTMMRCTEAQEETPYPRGRGVGGSSAINGMMIIRGVAADYDRWADDLGCDGWGWHDMLPSFLSVEDDRQYAWDGLHGAGGGVVLDRPGADTAYHQGVWAAAQTAGYPVTHRDYHADGATGMSQTAFTVSGGRRVSTNDTFLDSARSRANLVIRGDIVVDRVALEGTRAVGIVTSNGELLEAQEVILAAGALGSPSILLRSGIGPETGLAVGQNLMDHPIAPFIIKLSSHAWEPLLETPNPRSVLRYSSTMADAGPNDMQILFASPFGNTSDALGVAVALPSVLQVHSRGQLSLRSTDPLAPPIVDMRMLSDERDLHRLRDGVHRLLHLLDQRSLSAIVDSVSAGSRTLHDIDSDTAIDDWLMRESISYLHASGGCTMGAPDDPHAVVDPQGRVIGYQRLRVCDASIMPDIPRANSHLPTVAIADRMSRLIRASR